MSANAPGLRAHWYGLPNNRWLLVLYLPVLAFLLLVTIVTFPSKIALLDLTRDMAAIAHVHPFTGVVSNVGILLWCATAAICLFSSGLLREQGLRAEARFLLWGGLLTTLLLVDDLFMVHEYIAPVNFHVNEKLVLASDACAAGAYLLSQRRVILADNYHLLATAMVLFMASMLVDFADGAGWWRPAEDGFKLLGIASWFGYHAARARHWLSHPAYGMARHASVVPEDKVR